MKTVLLPSASRVGVIGVAVCLALLCSCATAPCWFPDDSIRPDRPAEAPINEGAGRGANLFVVLHLENGEALPLVVDTGAPFTVLDSSLEPRLGKRLGTAKMKSPWYGKLTASVYQAPKLYLGDTPLVTGKRVLTADLCHWVPGWPALGILGMDCLRHYCAQLDFIAGKMRFLDPDHLKTEDLGKAFPLAISFFTHHPTIRENLLGVKSVNSLIDTGYWTDGALKSKLWRQWTNQWSAATGSLPAEARSPNGRLEGETYGDLMLGKGPENYMGLRFLARHLVTLNFPKRTLYLRHRSGGPPTVQRSSTNSPGHKPGCWDTAGNDKESLAQRLASAPNLHPSGVLPDIVAMLPWRPRFLSLQIPVGPPAAKVSAFHLPPGDYHLKIVSKASRKEDGDSDLSMEGVPENVGPVAPIPERGAILLLHDYNSQKEFLSPWAFVLARAGYRVVLVDLRGHGESTGRTVSYGKYEVADLSQVLDSLTQERLCGGTVGALGIGYGAALALHWAARDSRVGAVVAIAPYNRPEQILEKAAEEYKRSLSTEMLRQAFALVAARLDIDWSDWSAEAALRQIQEPVFLIGGGKDNLCSTNDLEALVKSAPSGSKCLLVADADHGNVGYWFHEIGEPIKAWFQEHLPGLPDGQSEKHHSTSQ